MFYNIWSSYLILHMNISIVASILLACIPSSIYLIYYPTNASLRGITLYIGLTSVTFNAGAFINSSMHFLFIGPFHDSWQNESKDMFEMGIIKPSNSVFNVPVVLVKKKYGTNRFCMDFGKLNNSPIQPRTNGNR